PVKACIFDLDGLLINTEDLVGDALNGLLAKHGRPPLTPAVRASLMGVLDATKSDAFHDWAQLPISRDQWAQESSEQMLKFFTDCEPMPGAQQLLSTLTQTSNISGTEIKVALASGSRTSTYGLKTTRPETKQMLSVFEHGNRILSDDPRNTTERNKPAPDIFLLALKVLNDSTDSEPILPNECVVFEDSIVGVEAARRAGMRVVWVPHPAMKAQYQDRISQVLAGRIGLVDIGDTSQLGELDDGWGECIPCLDQFDYKKYGINQ
ncbi:hypothetical protein Golomagni_07944, partial [Golovinomyces magnicellulatus]